MMESGLIIQLVVLSLVTGVTYFLIASGLSLVYGVLNIVNFAHGQFFMLGAFGAYFIFQVSQLNFFLTLVLSMIAVGIAGIVIELAVFRPLRGEELPSTMVGLGLVLLMPAVAQVVWNERDKNVTTPFPGVTKFLGASITNEKLVILAAGLVIMVCLFLFLRYHKAGIAMRAVAQNPVAAAMFGIKVDHIHSLAMGLGCALAGAAGVLTASLSPVNPQMGGAAVFTAFVVVILGGLGSIPGALLGGVILGLVNNFGQMYIGPLANLVAFAMVIVVILVRPAGLLGHE